MLSFIFFFLVSAFLARSGMLRAKVFRNSNDFSAVGYGQSVRANDCQNGSAQRFRQCWPAPDDFADFKAIPDFLCVSICKPLMLCAGVAGSNPASRTISLCTAFFA
jgi:hypothetical protein